MRSAFAFAGLDHVRKLRKTYDEAIAMRTEDTLVATVVNDHLAALCPTIVLGDRERARRSAPGDSGSSGSR